MVANYSSLDHCLVNVTEKMWQVTVLYRQMPFKKGDRVVYNGEEWRYQYGERYHA